jgi:2-polyprenyl-6-methoxyphenol hydroxylase-like FAD-dependent oxidoreductase
VHPPGVAALGRWGLLERLEATGCPPVETYSFDFGPLTISGSPQPLEGIAYALCPRRTVLDQLLLEAAAEAGAEVREGFVVEDLVADDGAVKGVRGHGRGEAAVA